MSDPTSRVMSSEYPELGFPDEVLDVCRLMLANTLSNIRDNPILPIEVATEATLRLVLNGSRIGYDRARETLVPEGSMVVDKKQYAQLVKDSEFLSRLEAAGVDNWDGYHMAYDEDEEEV